MRRILWGVFLFSILISCGSAGNSGGNKVVVVGTASLPITLDPAQSTDSASSLIIRNIYEGLVGYTGEDMEIKPVLAERYEISPEGLEYTFYLRRGVKFQNGEDFNADAVLFSYLRQHDDNSPYRYGGNFVYWRSTGFKSNIADIKKVDDYTVKILLRHRDGSFIPKMAMPFAAIVSPKNAMEVKEGIISKPIGTGPYQLVDWKKDQVLTLKKNTTYRDVDSIKNDQVILRQISDPSARTLALQKGEIDIFEMPSPQDVDSLVKNPSIDLGEKQGAYALYLMLNNSLPPFNNVKVREAIAHLVNKEGIVQTILMGRGRTLVNPMPQSFWSYDTSIEEYDYNVDKAKALLVEAGYPNGFEMEILYNNGNITRKGMGEILQADFAKAGIKVSVRSLEWGAFLDLTKNAKYNGGAISGWVADYVDPDNYLSSLFSSEAAVKPANNTAFYMNPEFDALLKKALDVSDLKERTQLYEKAQQIFHRDIPAIPLYSPFAFFPHKKELKGVVVLPTGDMQFRYFTKE